MTESVENIESPQLHVAHEWVATTLDVQLLQLPELRQGVQLSQLAQVGLVEDQRVHVGEAGPDFGEVGRDVVKVDEFEGYRGDMTG